MADLHLTRELLEAVSRGELPQHLVTQIGIQHLIKLCPTCRGEIAAFEEARRRAQSPAHYAEALKLLPALLEEQIPRLEEEERQARQDFEELMSLPPEGRASRVRRARRRFRSSLLVWRLVAESQQRVLTDPEDAFRMAELGRAVAHHNPRMPGVFDMIALTTAHMANARRAGGELREAEGHFGHVQYVVTHQGVTNLEVLARVAELEGSLRKDQRRFEEAEGFLTRAAMLYRVTGSTADAGRVLLNVGSMLFYRGEVDRALEAVRETLRKLPLREDRRLYLCARHNLSFYLTEAGRFTQAADELAESESLYEEFPDRWTQLRLSWLRGRIAAGFGNDGLAEDLFLQTRDGFIAQGNGYDAAMVSLELATIYLRTAGRSANVKRLAEEIRPILQAQNVHREAAAALLLFREAALQEKLTAAWVGKLAAYLKSARLDSSLKFSPAGLRKLLEREVAGDPWP